MQTQFPGTFPAPPARPPVQAVGPPPGSPGPPKSAGPTPARPRSPLARLTLSVAVAAVGVLLLVDLTGVHVPAGAYLALPLAIVGGGLVVGAWHGRSYWLIPVGAVLGLVLAIVAPVEDGHVTRGHSGVVTWRPAGFEQLQGTYQISAGNGVLDLSGLDFTGRDASVDVRVSVGNLRVVLPSTVDVDLRAAVDVGNATVFEQHWGGVNQSAHTITDNGPDGPGGGHLTLAATVGVGDLEVRR